MKCDSLPKGWSQTTLQEIIKVSSGQNLTKSSMNEGEIPVYGGNGVTGFHSDFNVTEETIVIGRVGFYCGSVHLTPKRAWVTDNALITSFSGENLCKSYLLWLLRHTDLRANDSGSAQPVISGAKIYPTQISFPPLAEQKVIAEKLDTLLAQVDNTKARLERIPEILKRFRQSVLAAAVSGKLTEAWRGDASYCAMKLNLEKAAKSIEIPTTWSKITLSDSCKVISGNAFKSQDFLNEGQVPAIKISNVQYGQFEIKNQQFLPLEYLEAYKNFIVSDGDLLMALTRPITNDTLKVCRYPVGEPVGLLNQRVAKFIFKNEDEKAFFELLFQSDYFKVQVLDKLSETLQPNLSPVDLKKFIVALPSELEQTEVVRRVEELFAFADRIEQSAQAALGRVNNLTQSILAKAFRGELTADWRAANPELISGENSAEALLARIKAERAKLKPTKKAKA